MVPTYLEENKKMEIEIHGYVVTIHRMKIEDIIEMVSEALHIDYSLLRNDSYKERLVLVHAFGKVKESLSIRGGTPDETGYYNYVTLNLHGSFFDHSPDFKLEELLSYINKYKYTPKQLDVAFTDNLCCLTVQEVVRWCNESPLYCTGSLVRNVPGVRYTAGSMDRIELSRASSKTNYGTIYVRPDTGYLRVEIKFKSEDKIKYLLGDYSISTLLQFEARCLKALVGCIDFITPSSKRKRSPDKYIRQQSWMKFIESDVTKINWNEQKIKATSKRMIADGYDCNKDIRRMFATVQNTIHKLSPMKSEEDILINLGEHFGYMMTKINKSVLSAELLS
jgi:hypothetical protein